MYFGGVYAMSFSEEFFDWGVMLRAQITGEGIVTVVTRSPEDWSNRSTNILVETDVSACDLSVWDSGDAELVTGSQGVVSSTHLELQGHLAARELFEKFVQLASAVAGQNLKVW